MNRYVAAGLVADMQAGKRILFVAENIPVAREAMRQTEEANSGPIKIKWTNGAERLSSENGGFIRFVSARSKSHRGLAVDMVVFHGMPDVEQFGEYYAMRPTEMINL